MECTNRTYSPTDYPHFMSKTRTPTRFAPYIERVLLLERLREVNALLGFTRVEAPEESEDLNERPQMASLSRSKPDWVPANQVHGEGYSCSSMNKRLWHGNLWTL